MEQLEVGIFCQRAALEIAALIRHQRRPRGPVRQDSALLRRCVEAVLSVGPRPDHLQGGPWVVSSRPLKRPGRGGLTFIPVVQRGKTSIMVSGPREAEDLAAFLNYCGMGEFN